jgi:protein TonB
MSLTKANSHSANKLVVVIGSLGANVVLWFALGQGSNQPVPVIAPPELVIDRVVMDQKQRTAKPVFHPIIPKPTSKPRPQKHEEAKPIRAPQPTPEGAHNQIVTSKAPSAPKSDDKFVVPSGGKAELGKPTDSQNPGNGAVNPTTPPPTTLIVPGPVSPPTVDKTPATTPPAGVPVKIEDPSPALPPVPKPKGETREAKPDRQENVEIPENLKSQGFKSFVRVRVNIGADGKFTVALRTSSGNTDVDKLVLDTLNKWTWKPALKDGEPVDSVQQFRFNFSVE